MKPLRTDEIYSVKDLSEWLTTNRLCGGGGRGPVKPSTVKRYLRELNVPLTYIGQNLAIPGSALHAALTRATSDDDQLSTPET